MNPKIIQRYALKTSMALANFYHSVQKVYPATIQEIQSEDDYYLGVKELVFDIKPYLDFLSKSGYHTHTIDKASHSGRGIDTSLMNPLTGRFMTGSSSGTALNVFLGINDIGIGTDGGGSVLSPAATLNLCGFIHPELGYPYVDLKQYQKQSTDSITFTPSLGVISRNLFLIEQLASNSLSLVHEEEKEKEFRVLMDRTISASEIKQVTQDKQTRYSSIDLSQKYQMSRNDLMQQLKVLLATSDILISKEGPIDLNGIGDTVFGHFDEQTQAIQQRANKGFVRVVNMCHAVGLIVPCKELATGFLIVGKPQNTIVQKMFEIAKYLMAPEDPLVVNYFANHKAYFQNGIDVSRS